MAKDIMLYWGSDSPPCWRVMIALEEKQLRGYNNKLLSFDKQEHKCAEVMKLNPRGQLPTMKHGDTIVNESFAACMYLENEVAYYGWLVPEEERHESALNRNKENFIAELKLWNGYLEKMGKGSYLAGKNFTMADVVCFPIIGFLHRLGCPKDKCPRLMEYFEMVKDRPSIKASWPPKSEGEYTLKDL